MKRQVTQTPAFASKVQRLIARHQIKREDFDDFKKKIAENPEMGDIIQSTGGVRKARLKSASKGTRGGFRVGYYFHDVESGEIFLLVIYSKNMKEDISPGEKRELKLLVNIIKRK